MQGKEPKIGLIGLPGEVQVHLLSFLQACDLSAAQQSCRFFNNKELIHSIVVHTSQHVYGPEFTGGIVSLSSNEILTLSHLREMEVSMVAKILSSPEPKTGMYVSKAWIKKTLLWLESVNSRPPTKKLNKKQRRQRARRLSDVSPPWPDVNSDLLCTHSKLQRCGAKAARSRRRLMDKQAWKILKKLYPDSTQLESIHGECLQCLMEAETARKNERDQLEREKLQRKLPLSNHLVRRFYTRTRGVPVDCLVSADKKDNEASNGRSKSEKICPLKDGTYVLLPRVWCHKWRRYMKTGEGPLPSPPDSSAVLCHAHKFVLLPPHLEAYLRGETAQLHAATKAPSLDFSISPTRSSVQAPSVASIPVGMQPVLDEATMGAMAGAGLSRVEIASQQMAMLQLQQSNGGQEAQRDSCNSGSLNDVLDRENHVVVELLTLEECNALLETGSWPNQFGNFTVQLRVDDQTYHVSTGVCRECDPTGSRFSASAEVKYRRKRWEPKSVESRRTPKVEY